MGSEDIKKEWGKNGGKARRPFHGYSRKLAAAGAVLALGALLASVPCMASGTDTADQPGSGASRQVYAKYETKGEDGAVSAQVADGAASVTLPDGTVVSISGAGMEGLYLQVFPIPEETGKDSAWQWFAGQMEGKGTGMRPYDIWFEDAYGQAQAVDGVIQVSITPAPGVSYQNPAVYYQPLQGNPVDLNAAYTDGTIRFSATHNSYYVLLERMPESGTEEESTQTPESSTEEESAQTPESSTEEESTQTPESSTEGETSQNPETSTEGESSQSPETSTEGETAQSQETSMEGESTQTPETSTEGETAQSPGETQEEESTQETREDSESGTDQTKASSSSDETGDSAGGGQGTPNTGDPSDICTWMAVLFASLSAGGGIGFLQYNNKKKK